MPPPLPPELIDHIIDYLHDSPSTLRTCALVCQAWIAPSRFHLFYFLSIGPKRRSSVPLESVSLLQLLQESPNIALYIREFHFSVGSKSQNSDWPVLDRILPRLLGKLTQLRKLVIRGIFPFTRLAPDTRAAFRALFALPSLAHVQVASPRVPKLEHFTSLLCPPLKHLTTSRSFDYELFHPEDVHAVDEEVRAVELQRRSPCRLESLSSSCPALVNWLLGAQTVVDISTIRTLVVFCELEDVEQSMARLIRRLGSSLEDLTIRSPNIEEWDGPTEDTIDVRYNPNIRRLVVDIAFEPELASYLKYLLSSLSAPNIQQITIVVMPFSEIMNWQGWNEVDHVLAGAKFGRLREVAIVVHGRNVDMIRQDLIDQFPSMYDKGILNISTII